MANKRLMFLAVLAISTLLSYGCGLAPDGSDDGPTSPVNPSDPHNGDGAHGPPPGLSPGPGDLDGDGFPDEVDLTPCMALYFLVWSQNVSTAVVSVNGVEIVPASAFPTQEVLGEFLNLPVGDNEVALDKKLTGSQEDLLHVFIGFAIDETRGAALVHQTILREQGPPQSWSYPFVIETDGCP